MGPVPQVRSSGTSRGNDASGVRPFRCWRANKVCVASDGTLFAFKTRGIPASIPAQHRLSGARPTRFEQGRLPGERACIGRVPTVQESGRVSMAQRYLATGSRCSASMFGRMVQVTMPALQGRLVMPTGHVFKHGTFLHRKLKRPW